MRNIVVIYCCAQPWTRTALVKAVMSKVLCGDVGRPAARSLLAALHADAHSKSWGATAVWGAATKVDARLADTLRIDSAGSPWRAELLACIARAKSAGLERLGYQLDALPADAVTTINTLGSVAAKFETVLEDVRRIVHAEEI